MHVDENLADEVLGQRGADGHVARDFGHVAILLDVEAVRSSDLDSLLLEIEPLTIKGEKRDEKQEKKKDYRVGLAR